MRHSHRALYVALGWLLFLQWFNISAIRSSFRDFLFLIFSILASGIPIYKPTSSQYLPMYWLITAMSVHVKGLSRHLPASRRWKILSDGSLFSSRSCRTLHHSTINNNQTNAYIESIDLFKLIKRLQWCSTFQNIHKSISQVTAQALLYKHEHGFSYLEKAHTYHKLHINTICIPLQARQTKFSNHFN